MNRFEDDMVPDKHTFDDQQAKKAAELFQNNLNYGYQNP
jgi:hypothetical protein